MSESVNRFQKTHDIKTKITSMWLEEDDSTRLKLEYCGTCRAPLFQHQGGVVMTVPGDSPSKLPFYLQCRNKKCGRKYKIHAILRSDA